MLFIACSLSCNDKIKENEIGGHLERIGEMTYTMYWSRRRWEDNIEIDLKEKIGRVCAEFIWLRIETSN
jgi:hypothetical protein